MHIINKKIKSEVIKNNTKENRTEKNDYFKDVMTWSPDPVT